MKLKIKHIFLILTICLVKNGVSQSVFTYAGGNGSGGSGNNGIAVNAQLNSPEGIVFDANGNLFIADYDNNAIRRVDYLTNVITKVVWIQEDNTSPIYPTALTLKDSLIFFIDENTMSPGVRKYNINTGVVSLVYVLSGTYEGICLKNGILYLTNTSQHTIDKLTYASGSGWALHPFAGQPNVFGSAVGSLTMSTFYGPSGIQVDNDGNLIISDSGSATESGKIRKINLFTQMVTTIATGLDSPKGLAIGADGFIYIAESFEDKVLVLKPISGIVENYVGTGNIGFVDSTLLNSDLNSPVKLAIDPNNYLYISDQDNDAIRNTGCYTAEMPIIKTSTGTNELCSNLLKDSYIYVDPLSKLNDNTKWVWHKETCNGVELFVGDTLSITSSLSSKYTVRGEVGCDQGEQGICEIIDLKVINCDSDTTFQIITNTFSPNGDGVNDDWILPKLPIGSRVLIYNRWGDVVKQVDNYNNSDNVWDGKSVTGELVSSGTYFYVIEKENNKIASGWMQVIR